jgi:hypothetical protein
MGKYPMTAATTFLEELIGIEFLEEPQAVATAKRAFSMVKKLKLPEDRLKEGWLIIFDALVEYDLHNSNELPSLPFSKAEKQSAEKLQKYFRQIRAEAKNYPKNYYGFTKYKQINELPLGDLINSLEFIIKGKIAPQNRTDGQQKKLAAKFALGILNLLHIKTTTTRGSQFCKLSAEIYGDPDNDFHHICRSLIEGRNQRKTGQT